MLVCVENPSTERMIMIRSIVPDAIGIAAGSIALLFGQVAEHVPELTPYGLGNLIQGGAFAVLAYTLLHLVTKTLPRRDKEYAEMVEAITNRYSAAMDRQADRSVQVQGEVAKAITELRVHCAERLKADRLRNEAK